MNILSIIAKKRDKKVLTKEEIELFVKDYTRGVITDYQAAALIMAIYINGMTNEEITNLTLAMANSGDTLDLTDISPNIVDKHSTGGVGDKITLILMPIVASLGIPVAKMSGRGLGFTGGTIDKLESIPGYTTNVDIETFKRNVKKIGISLIGQTLNLAPADKKIYALRDTISCVENMSLIASSIMSKKIAAGANKVVLDVTCGSGAFMKNEGDAIKLSTIMKKIGELADKETVCVITNMDEPLGKNVGNTLEILEVIEALRGKMEEDVKQVVLELGAHMIKLAGKGNSIEENKKKITGGSYIMYSEKVMDHFQHPRNVGEIENASGVGTVGNAKCGDIMRMFLDIDDKTHIIKECKFKTFGCGAAVATSSMATEMVKGKTIEEAMQITNKAVMEALDGLPPVKVHCSLLAEEAIHAALWDYAQKHGIVIEGLDKPKSDISEGEEEEEY